MEDQYNPEYAQRVLERFERLGSEKIFFENLVVTGRENLTENQDRQRIYIANHVSHMDYAMLWIYFHQNDIKMPMIPAGKNLDNWFLKFVGLDFGQLCAYFVDKDLMQKNGSSATQHKKDTIRATREIIKNELDFLVFPEGGRNDNEKLFEKYDKGALRAALYDKRDLDIVPVAFGYDHRVEEKFISTIRKGNRKTLLGKSVYYGVDAYACIANRPIAKFLGFNVGNAYISIGKPKPLSEIAGNNSSRTVRVKAVKQFSIEEVTKLHSAIHKNLSRSHLSIK